MIFFGPFSLEKRAGKNPPKNSPKNPRFSRELSGQNPLKVISALMKVAVQERGFGEKVACGRVGCGGGVEAKKDAQKKGQ